VPAETTPSSDESVSPATPENNQETPSSSEETTPDQQVIMDENQGNE
jgi:hypothetical protein